MGEGIFMYEECYLNALDIYADIDMINLYYEKNRHHNYYRKNDMRCPECHIAQLTYVAPINGTNHLRANNAQEHSDNCTIGRHGERIARRQIRLEISTLTSAQIAGRLNAKMNRLLADNGNVQENIQNNAPQNRNARENNNNVERIQQNVRLPERLLNQSISRMNLENDYYLFYGSVRLRVTEHKSRNNKDKYPRLIISNLEGNLLAYINFNWSHIGDFDDTGTYFIVIWGMRYESTNSLVVDGKHAIQLQFRPAE